MSPLRALSLAALAAFALFPAGCGTSPAPAQGDYLDVSGTVTLADGSPMKSGTIHFEPDGAGREELVKVADGKYSVKMFEGKYKVAFDVGNARSSTPAKYTKFATTDKRAEVKSGNTTHDFQLK